jgi:hypothetical protein
MAGIPLNGTIIADTYVGLIKTTDNNTLESGQKRLTDGCGNETALTLGVCSQASQLDGALTVTGVFAANSLTYPQTIGNANDIIISDGSGGSSFTSLNVALSTASLSSNVINNSFLYKGVSAIRVDNTGKVNDVITSVYNRPNYAGFLTPPTKFTGSAGTVEYNLDTSFVGNISANYDSDKIYEVLVQAWASSDNSECTFISSNINDAALFNVIAGAYGTNNDDDNRNVQLVKIPINPGQKTFKLKLEGRDFSNTKSTCTGWRLLGVNMFG